MNRMIHIGLVAIATSTIGLAGSASAAGSTSVFNCTVTPANPFIEYRGGIRGVGANVYVKCTVGRTGIVNAQIRENDTVSDDEVTPIRSASFTILAGQTQKVLSMWGACNNFDATGAEELFSRAKINIGGINSAWANTPDVSASC